MKYWAGLDAENTVFTTSVSASDDFGGEWLSANVGGVWVEYWRDGGERKNPATIGGVYDEARDAFIPPKPFESWVLDEDTCLWVAPVPMPEDGAYSWDEEAGEWVAADV